MWDFPLNQRKHEMSNTNTIATIGTTSFTSAKGLALEITTVAALAGVGGVRARKAVAGDATQTAIGLALGGRYRPAAEILQDAFKAQAKAWARANGDALPWANKTTFESFVASMAYAKVPAKGWPESKANARLLLSELAPAATTVTLEMEAA